MADLTSTANPADEREARAERLYEKLQGAFLDEARRMSKLLADTPDGQLFGKTEFELRDAMHRLGSSTLQTALTERKKGGIEVRA